MGDSHQTTGTEAYDDVYSQLAEKHWLKNKKPVKRISQPVLEQLLKRLQDDSFSRGALLRLESLQLLERYLWPPYSEDATNTHVLLIALVLNTKCLDNIPSWTLLTDRAAEFSSLFRRITALALDVNSAFHIRTQILVSIIGIFQSLDNAVIRKECAPLVSIGIWHHLHSEAARNELLEHRPQFKKAWRLASKRFEAADDTSRARIGFERSWLYTLLIDFLDILFNRNRQGADAVGYCERFLEFLIDLQSQFPTRRYFNTLLQNLNFLVALRLSPLVRENENELLQDLAGLLQHYTAFPFDDHSREQISERQVEKLHQGRLASLQRTAYRTYKDKLSLLTLANFGALEDRAEFQGHLDALDDGELLTLADTLGLRTEYPENLSLKPSRSFMLNILLANYERRPDYRETIASSALLPTEQTLYDPSFIRNERYDGSRPVALPKLNLQYLTAGDFLWRSFTLFRSDAFYQIRTDLEDTVDRLKPRRDFTNNVTRFDGSSRLAAPIQSPAIVEVVAPSVGEVVPSQVKAEVIINTHKLSPAVKSEWESLRQGDVVFLLSVQPDTKQRTLTNGGGKSHQEEEPPRLIQRLRSAELIQVQDDQSRPIRAQSNGPSRSRQLRLLVNLDARAYYADLEAQKSTKTDVYDSLNLVVRRKSRENNFKPMLESIQRLALSDVPMPIWLEDVFLGLGNPAGATYQHMADGLKSVDFRDTFLDWQHLKESLPKVLLKAEPAEPLAPPYVLEQVAPEEDHDGAASKRRRRDGDGATATADDEQKSEAVGAKSKSRPVKPSKKRRRSEAEADTVADTVKVSSYLPPNNGPYPSDVPKINTVRFTPAQVEAITSGTQPGLTVIVGPPGTGKTDVATQIINNIYHNFPQQRTLLIAHSNQALNQLFQKIVALDIDERHLLRLGHGEGELQLDSNSGYSKHGRVESFLENGARLLLEVGRLAASVDAPGAHGSSCETAEYFNKVYIQPAWTRYWSQAVAEDADVARIVQDFPFHVFFANAPQPLFPEGADKNEALEVAQGCIRHVDKIFTELEDIRPFEILRHARDKANYLLVNEARIIAMTSTHAAMRRAEIAALGFEYDNVIMEEAAQITEVEAFIPLALQKPDKGQLNLKRIVMCGDHLQNSPIIQNLAFRQYANLEQSMFQRLVRLGVPHILLDKQGRARPSIADLYRWRYPGLDNLSAVTSLPEYLQANPGLRHEYQFIDVPDYKGRGESEPSPHFIQNLGEAEYLVALYMYMRLLGYPAASISILATYAGQVALIKDVLAHRCAKNRLFGLPRAVSTVDRYQGEQNDYILLSLTRTSRPGYLRDIRRLTVALSRARLGLYVFGRREVFEQVPELRPAFDLLLQRPDTLQLVTGELFDASSTDGRRLLDSNNVQSTDMAGVEHLGQYVHEMTAAKMASLRAGDGQAGVALHAAADPTQPDEQDEYGQAAGSDDGEEDDGEEDDEEADGGVPLS